MTLDTLGRHVQRVRHELKRRDLTVLRVQALGPHVRSVTFGGETLADFVSVSFDDHVKLMLDSGGPEPVRRDYTPRHFDPAARELTIEFALHGDGPAARWAAQARPGQTVTVGGPRGSFIVPMDFDWHLLVGDETALPAVARRLAELPAGTPVTAVLRVADPADRRALPTQADLTLQWVDDDAALITAVQAWPLPPGDGYAWCAAEARTAAALRHVLVAVKGQPRNRIRALAYWKRGTVARHEDIE